MITQPPLNPTPLHPPPLKTEFIFSRWSRLIQKMTARTSLNSARDYMGLNERQLHFINRYNRKDAIEIADNKWKAKSALSAYEEFKIKVPQTYLVAHCYQHLKLLESFLKTHDQGVVIKPVHGWGGKGILVLKSKRDAEHYVNAEGQVYSIKEILLHAREILSGMFSLGGRPDQVLVEELIHFSAALRDLSYGGVPDIRVVLYRGVPISAMLRLATRESNGCANLSKGGVGVGLLIKTGQTTHAVQSQKTITHHPDTQRVLRGFTIPHWNQVIMTAIHSARVSQLGFCGVDIVLDQDHQPLLLEFNARPGLAIQMANHCGHLPRAHYIDEWLERSPHHSELEIFEALSNNLHIPFTL